MNRTMTTCIVLAAALWMTPTAPAQPTPEWHHRGAPYRLVVGPDTPRLNARLDAAELLLDATGLAELDRGQSIRVTDARGTRLAANVQPVPVPGHAGRLFRVVFRMPEGATAEDRYCVYFGGQAVQPMTFIPERGRLMLSTGPLPKGTPRRYDAEDFRRLVDRFKPAHTGPRRRIDDLENPFGDNLLFMSVYRGHLDLSRPGTYELSANCDDTCLVALDGDPLLVRNKPGFSDAGPNRPIANNWALRKTVTVGNNPGNTYKPGVYRLTFVHLQLSGGGDKPWTLARLGWKPPWRDTWEVVPDDAYIDMLRVKPVAMESARDGRLPWFTVRPLPTLVINDRRKIYRLELAPLAVVQPDGLRFSGPGGKALAGPTPELVTDKPGWVEVTMSAPGGRTCRRMVELTGHDPTRLFVELSPRSDNTVVFRGQPARLTFRLRNVNDPIDLSAHLELMLPDGQVTELEPEVTVRPAGSARVVHPDAGAMALKLGAEAYVELSVTLPAETVDTLGRGDVVARFDYRGTKALERRVLLRSPDNLPEDLALADGLPVSGDHPVVLLENRRARQEMPRAKDIEHVLIAGNLLGNTDEVMKALEAGLGKATGGSVSVDRLPGSGTVLQDLPRLRRIRIEPGTLVLLGYGQEDMQMGTPPGDFEGLLSVAADVMAERGATVVLVSPTARPTSRRLSLEMATAVKKVALKRDMPVVDLYSYLGLRPDLSNLYRRGNTAWLHPRGDGAARLVDYVVRQVADELK